MVAEAGDLDATRRYVRAHRPRVLVLDLNLPEGSSLPAIPELREQSPETAVVVLTMQQDPAFAREAMRAGALGYVLKHSAGNELVDAVRAAAAGETYLNPKLGAQLAARPTRARGSARRADRARGRDPAPDRPRPHELGDRRAALPERADRRVASRAHPAEDEPLDPRGAGPLRARPRSDRVGGHGDRGTRPGGQRDRVGHRPRRPAGVAAGCACRHDPSRPLGLDGRAHDGGVGRRPAAAGARRGLDERRWPRGSSAGVVFLLASRRLLEDSATCTSGS